MDLAKSLWLFVFFALAVCVLAEENEETLEELEDLCTGDKVCFVSPQNCQLAQCQIILSYNSTTSSLMANNQDEENGVFLYNGENDQIKTDKFFACVGSGRCFEGKDVPSQPIEFLLMQKGSGERISDELVIWKFPRVVAQTGPDVTYWYREGNILDTNSGSLKYTKLHHLSSSKPAFQTNFKKDDLLNLDSIYRKYEEVNGDAVMNAEPENSRFKKSRYPVDTVSLGDIISGKV